MPTDHEELLRLRDRIHALANTVTVLEHRVAAQAKRCEHVEELVTAMEREDAIASAVAARMRREHLRLFSWPVRTAGFLVSLCAIASFVLQVAK